MELSRTAFDLLRAFVHDICGLAIGDDKQYLVRQRLQPLVESTGCGSFEDFYHHVKHNCPAHVREEIIHAITTNETSFFRDEHPYRTFKEFVLPRLADVICHRKANPAFCCSGPLNIWSAASSTGQEPYSIAMLIGEYLDEHPHKGIAANDFRILATDISKDVLAYAVAGKYTDMEVQRGVSPQRLAKFFRKEGTQWHINERLRPLIEFRQANLAGSFVGLGTFDVIFCRNVIIYFDMETKIKVLSQMTRMLSNDGFLFVGTTENTYGLTDAFETVRYGETVLYQKRSNAPAANTTPVLT